MPIQFHPKPGTILLCNFEPSFKEPEMVSRRPVVVLSPQISTRPNLCTVVAISTQAPRLVAAYHFELPIVLPLPYERGPNWIKGDMVYSVAFHRLDLISTGRIGGERSYYKEPLSAAHLKQVRACVLCGLGLASLTKHLP